MNFDTGREFKRGDLQVSTSYYESFPVITVAGSCDLYSVPALQNALDYAVEARARQLIVDLRDVQYMDSSGFKVLVEAHKAIKAASDGVIVIVDLQPPIYQSVKLLHLDSLMVFVHTKEQAAEVLQKHQLGGEAA